MNMSHGDPSKFVPELAVLSRSGCETVESLTIDQPDRVRADVQGALQDQWSVLTKNRSL